MPHGPILNGHLIQWTPFRTRCSKDRFEIGSKCIIANDVDLRGDITIGSGVPHLDPSLMIGQLTRFTDPGCILHPKCTIVASSGPIVIGNNNIIEEQAVIVNRSKCVMQIGNDNHFRVGSRAWRRTKLDLVVGRAMLTIKYCVNRS